ncbi:MULTISPECIES: DUF3662 and FHA domain-containing protein [unclassified Allobranchiibius]|uniref:FhaA domain-containing protein n=1 Tax=unclassified Allobranchiibius TaxID=2649857 RepID=UPI001AA1D0DE|nr:MULTISPECIES: DUF3662 and FHA domain-containing protein [unclassified Allobranchiibius]MBO1768367.1 DUF3662 domain-containing protein [Allobranchiibius sp. GilTou38]UIJ35515.1 DUF3662 domain-containing protein [Allobranchiibius sp. GilTou73]
MGLFSNLERRLSEGVNGAFAKAFRSEVQPVEIASAMRGAMDDRAAATKKGQRAVVPNLFTVDLSPGDFERLDAARDDITDELIASATEHADSQRYVPGGPVSVQFAADPELETGVFRLRPSIARQVQEAPQPSRPQPRQYDEFDPSSARQDQPWDEGRRPLYDDGPAPRQYQTPPREYPTPSQQYQVPQHHQQPMQQHPGYDDPAPEQPRAARVPSPAAPRRFKQRPSLIIDGDSYPLLGAITVIGRDDDADIMLDDPGISRRHSEIRITNDGPHLVMTVRDLGSTNGTFVNGDPIDRAHLHDGDRITVGRTHLLFREGGRR